MIEYEHTTLDTKITVGLVILMCTVHKKIDGPLARKWTSTVFGFGIIWYTMGFHIWHFGLCTLINAWINKYAEKRNHWLVSLVSVFYYSLSYSFYGSYSHQMNIIQMCYVAKITGLAFDIHNSRFEKVSDEGINPGFMDQIHFSYCFVDLSIGLFYRYRTYDDFINKQFAKHSQWKTFIMERAWKAIILIIIYGMYNDIWPMKYIFTSEFKTRSLGYKIMYGAIQMNGFTLLMTSGFLTSEIICCAAGFGAYPVQGANKCGHGPTENYKIIKVLNDEDSKNQIYDLKTIINANLYDIYFTPWLKVFSRSWNMTFQYWISMVVYKNLSKDSSTKKYAIIVSMLFSGLWHGTDPGFFISFFLLGCSLLTSRVYWEISFYLNGKMKILYLGMQYMLRQFLVGYSSISFNLLKWNYISYYFGQIYYIPLILHISIHMLGEAILLYLRFHKIR